MAIYKRGNIYWFTFVFNGVRYQRSTKQKDRKAARQMESAFRTALAKGEVGILERKRIPTLKDFAQRFIDSIQIRSAAKPRTITFYAEKLSRLLKFEPLANAHLDRIDEALIESYVQQRSKQVAPATVNRQLATLRRLLRLAQEWAVIDRVPRIRMLPGERIRDFVLSHEQERAYLGAASQPLQDVASVILDTGLRVGEAVALQWRDIHLSPERGAGFGYLYVRDGKSRYARRSVCLTKRVAGLFQTRLVANGTSPWVFSGSDGRPLLVTSLDHQHGKVREALGFPKDFVLHSLRHTLLTRLGEAGADAFTIMRIAAHSSVTISQRYVHPSQDAMVRAIERLELLNGQAARSLPKVEKLRLLPTVSATVSERVPLSH